MSLSRFNKIALVGLGALGGTVAYYKLNKSDEERNYSVFNSTHFFWDHKPSVKWIENWDCRDPKSIVKPCNTDDIHDQNRYNEELEYARGRASRHLILIRHGQYELQGQTDKERVLTKLGRLQADLTGKRLAQLGIQWDCLVRSTLTRAQETAKIIQQHLPQDIQVKDCSLLEEGAPIPPEPPSSHWKPPAKQFFQDGARIEAAFRRYFYRAPPDQANDTYTLLVCHANVIRFFVCRALQFPPESWLRMSLSHGSITWITVHPNGHVTLRKLSDTGFMDPQYITSSLAKKSRNGTKF